MLWLKIIWSFSEKDFEEVKKIGTKISEFLNEEWVVLEIVTLWDWEDFKNLEDFKKNNT